MTEKAVILARGLGERMRKADADLTGVELTEEAAHLADEGLKGLIPLHGRPFLDYVVDSLLVAGLRRICLVIAPDADMLRQYASDTSGLTGAEVGWAVQQDPLGTADAVLAAADFAGSDPFVMCNCDNLYPADVLSQLAQLSDGACYVAAFESEALVRNSNFTPDRVGSFAAIVATPEGELKEIVEKPPDPGRYVQDGKLWVNMNLFRFTPEIFDSCRQIEPSRERGELELPTAAVHLARSGRAPFRVVFASGAVLDLTRRGDVSAVERLLEGRMPQF